MKGYFEYKVSNIFSMRLRCLKVEVVDCSREKAIVNAERSRSLINLLDSVWDNYADAKKTRHGRQYKAI